MKEHQKCEEYYMESVFLVENGGMTDEKIYRTMNEIPDKTGYFLTMIAKRERGKDR